MLKRIETTYAGLGEIMPYCPHCGALVAEDATVCRNCGTSLRPQQPSAAQSPQPQSAPFPQAPQQPPAGSSTRNFAILGVISAIISLLVLPEVFGSAAIILGAYTWRKEQGNRGIGIVILGIICMIVGIEVTAPFWLGGLLPS
jgi:ribosomal protein L40E